MRVPILMCMVLAAAAVADAQPSKTPPARPVQARENAAQLKDVEVQASLDRSAIWVADRFTYTVNLLCRRGVDVLPDDLSRDKLKLEGPEVVSVDTARDDRGNGVTAYRITYHLTSYRLDPPIQKIGGMSVRYYVRRPGQKLDDVAPAGDVTIPGAVVAVRSLLPDAQDTASFRNSPPPMPRRQIFATLQPIGLGLVIVAIVPAGLWATVLVGRARHRQRRKSVRRVRHDERESLDALKAIDYGTEAGRREAYDRASALVRAHLRDVCGIPADGLTPAEIGPALTARGKDAPIDLVTGVLVACERARYASPGAVGSADDCRATVEQAEQVVATVR